MQKSKYDRLGRAAMKKLGKVHKCATVLFETKIKIIYTV